VSVHRDLCQTDRTFCPGETSVAHLEVLAFSPWCSLVAENWRLQAALKDASGSLADSDQTEGNIWADATAAAARLIAAVAFVAILGGTVMVFRNVNDLPEWAITLLVGPTTHKASCCIVPFEFASKGWPPASHSVHCLIFLDLFLWQHPRLAQVAPSKLLAYRLDFWLSTNPYSKILSLLYLTIALVVIGSLGIYIVSGEPFYEAFWEAIAG
jgi:hypothetical protein